MKIKIRHNHWITRLIKVGGITIYPYILLRDQKGETKRSTYKHELHHTYQVQNVGWICFYLSYLIYYFAGLLRYKSWNHAYHEIPYEAEAYAIQDEPLTKMDLDILKNEGIYYE